MCSLTVAVLHNLDVIQKLSIKGPSLEATAEFQQIRADIYAKAGQVQAMTESVAGLLAESAATEGRWGGQPDSIGRQLRVEAELKKVLTDAGTSKERQNELLKPFAEWIPFDYRNNICNEAMQIDRKRNEPPATVDSHQAELDKALKTGSPLDAFDRAKQLLSNWSMDTPELSRALEDYRQYLTSRDK